MSAWKSGLLAISLTAVVSTTQSQTNQPPQELDAMGIFKSPRCDHAFRVKSAIKNFSKEDPTGIKAVSSQWDMEIYGSADSTHWTLVGSSKPPGPGFPKLCWLARGTGGSASYEQQPWFKAFFKRAGST